MGEFLKSIAVDFWMTVAQMSPYLLFGFLVAGLLSVLIPQAFVERHLGGKGLWPLVKASIFGVPLPLCSCGVIPVSMSLHKHGASKSSTISFLLSTPQTGADSILVTLSLLGPVFAVFRPLVAFVTGIFGGALVDIFEQQNTNNKTDDKCEDECCGTKRRGLRLLDALRYGFITLPADIAKAILFGLVAAAFISSAIPDDFFVEKLPMSGFIAMLVMMVMGIPVYVCATASVPIAAALIAKGLTPGVALVFLITGPATNAASLITIWKVLGRRTAIIYLITVIVGAVSSGLLLDALFPQLAYNVRSTMHHMQPSIASHICAVVLLIVLAFAVLRGYKKQKGRLKGA